MRTMLRSKVTLLFMMLGMLLAVPAVALADQLANALDDSLDGTFETMALETGGKTQDTLIYVVPVDGDGGSGLCNFDQPGDKATVTVSSSATSVATAKWKDNGSASIDFTGCGTENGKTLTVTSGSDASETSPTDSINPADITFTTVNAFGRGNLQTNFAQFRVRTSAPTNTPPSVSVTGVQAGANYEFGSVPTAGCSVTDAEDTNESATPVVDSSGLNSYGLGPVQVTCSYTDGGGLTETASATYSIVDTTNPVLDLPANITREATSSAGAEVDFSADVSATDLVDGNVDVTCNPESGSTFALGTTTVTCTAIDDYNNTSTRSFTVTVVDTTGPALSLPTNITTTATSNSQATVNFTATANDLVDGSRPISCDPASGSTFSAGTTTVNCSSSDSRGNTSNGSFTVTVNYAWTGFFQPVDNAGVFNKVKIGSTVPVKFSLGGNQGLSIFFSSAYPQVSKPITCGVNPAVDTLEEYAPTGTNSGLKYDATANQYIYNWKTDGYKAGECRSLIVKLADGSVKTANFTFFK